MKLLSTYFILGLMMILSPVNTKAQHQPTGVLVHQNRIEIKDSKLYVDFDIDINGLELRSNEGILLTPILQADDTTKFLPTVVINGRNRNISHHRTMERSDNPLFNHEPYMEIRLKRGNRAIISYNTDIPAEPWMENATLSLREAIYGCGNNMLYTSSQIMLQNTGASVTMPPRLTYLSPTTGKPESRKDSVCFSVFFPEGVMKVLPDYEQNQQHIIATAKILTDTSLTITSIYFVGSASPKGLYSLNDQLAESRALSLSSFFETTYNTPLRLSRVGWIGEDWGTLLKLVEQSDMPSKQEVIHIIQSTTLIPERKDDLMRLASGAPYQYMMRHFFPQLRRVSYTIYYETSSFDRTKMRELLVSNPKILNVNEMLFVADSYPQGSAEYNNAIEIAVRTYPDDLIANLNTSSILLNAGNTAAANQYLERIKQWPGSWNNLGVLYLLEGNYELAHQYLQKAINSGNRDAEYNLKELIHRERTP